MMSGNDLLSTLSELFRGSVAGQGEAMFKNIAVAYDESPEAGRALTAAIRLATALHAGLQTITVVEELPAYTAYGVAADPGILRTLGDDRSRFYEQLQNTAREKALAEGVRIETHLLDGERVDAIVHFVNVHEIDLLIIGLHRRSLVVSRLWSTVYTLAQDVPCSVLGVH
jgi:nucleotide-binding universal stress UspA family protein